METITVLPLSLITCIVVLLSLYVTSLWHKRKDMEGKAPLPPGKTGFPIIGETLEFVRLGSRGYPENFIADRMRKFSGKVFRTSLMNENVAVFCGTSGNKFVFTNTTFTTSWFPKSITKLLISPENMGFDQSTFSMQGRKITNEFLKPELIQKKLIGVIDYMAKQNVGKYCSSQKQVLVYELAKNYTFSLVCHLILSLDDSERLKILKDLFEDIREGIAAIPLNFPGTTFHRALKSTRAFRKEILLIIKQRKIDDALCKNSDNEAFKDMLSHMLVSQLDQDGEFLRDSFIADMILGLIVAAHDTTGTTITCMVKYLTELPHVYAQVLQEQLEIAKTKKAGELLNWEDIQKMKYTWCVANETMRLTPPTPGAFRDVLVDFTYAGCTIPKGWKTYWTVHSTNRDPEIFKNPDTFDPTRFQESGPPPFAFVPFGGGSHICPGREYARLQILAFMHNFVTQFHFEKILPNEKISYLLGAFPVKGLPIRIYPRNG